jgi:integrase
LRAGDWTDPDRGKVKLSDYAAVWITERPGLRPRSADNYRWLLKKHVDPYLGGVPVGKLSTPMIREWRATLLSKGVSVSTAAKAYRFLRAVLMTAAEEDKILAHNPCRVRGAGEENAPERPVLAVAQVFELAGWVGRRPVGNIRKLPDGSYRLRFARHGERRTSPEVYLSRADADRALWRMMADGRADFVHDQRYRALVLLATFASLRWGEATALRRCDLDLRTRTVRVRAAYVERSTGEMVLGPPKSRAGRRIIGIPDAIIPALREHLAAFVKEQPTALVFPGQMGGPLRRGNFNKMSGWPHAVRAIGMEGLHFHDLRHAGNHLAAASGAGLKDLMARMGHDSERAALIYQHEARGADKRITEAIDLHLQAERDQGDDDDGAAGALVPAG